MEVNVKVIVWNDATTILKAFRTQVKNRSFDSDHELSKHQAFLTRNNSQRSPWGSEHKTDVFQDAVSLGLIFEKFIVGVKYCSFFFIQIEVISEKAENSKNFL